MAKQVFINLAVQDLQQSTTFYTAMGFSVNPQFSDETAKCMVWSEHIFIMLLSHEKFASFTTKPFADLRSSIGALYSLPMDSMDEVNKTMENALKAGGTEPSEMKDYGFMQQRTIEDRDGHTWELFYMDMSKIPSDQTNTQ